MFDNQMVFPAYAIEGCDTPLMWRIQSLSEYAELATPDDVARISYAVVDPNDPDANPTVTDLNVSTIMRDEPSTAGWSKDDEGWNARHVLPGADIPDGGKTYRVEYEVEYADGYVTAVLFNVHVTARRAT